MCFCIHFKKIAHDVMTTCLVRIITKNRARCCDYWELGNATSLPKRIAELLRKNWGMQLLPYRSVLQNFVGRIEECNCEFPIHIIWVLDLLIFKSVSVLQFFFLTSFSWRTPLQSLVGSIEECTSYRSVENLLKVYGLHNFLKRIKECNEIGIITPTVFARNCRTSQEELRNATK